MRIFIGMLMLATSSSALANMKLTAKIYQIDHGLPGEEVLIFLSNGKVATLSGMNQLNDLSSAQAHNSLLDITLNDRFKILNFRVITENKIINQGLFPETNNTYVPTVLTSLEIAKTYFSEGRYKKKESQCYNRAQVWTYEWSTKHNLNSKKTWLFFTRKYIRKFKFDWWFHVAPSVPVMEDGAIHEKVMDVKYMKGPVKLKQWTDYFIQTREDCPVVSTYSDYANYPETGSCFVMRSSMYYYRPLDLEMSELWNIEKTNWNDAEVISAFKDALEEDIQITK